MNREILFRGKRVDNGEWVEGSLIIEPDINNPDIVNHVIRTWRYKKLKYGKTISVNFHKVIPESVGQYTGLKDKNGKKIFEGDIIIFKNAQGYDDCIDSVCCSVVWEKDSFSYYIENDDIDIYDSLYDFTAPAIIEVIGNTTDNPELLEVNK